MLSPATTRAAFLAQQAPLPDHRQISERAEGVVQHLDLGDLVVIEGGRIGTVSERIWDEPARVGMSTRTTASGSVGLAASVVRRCPPLPVTI